MPTREKTHVSSWRFLYPVIFFIDLFFLCDIHGKLIIVSESLSVKVHLNLIYLMSTKQGGNKSIMKVKAEISVF